MSPLAPLAVEDQLVRLAPRVESAHWLLRPATGSFPDESVRTSGIGTTFGGDFRQLALYWLPLASAVLTAPPTAYEVIHEFQQPTATCGVGLLAPGIQEDAWEYVPDTVTRAEIEELQRIWALPYPGDVHFDIGRID